MNSLNAHYLFPEAPCVTIFPQSVTLSHGSLLSLSCDLRPSEQDGDLQPSFQWLKDEEVIPGATFPELVISPVSQDHEGTYTCRIFNNIKAVSSRSANVRITKVEDIARGRHWLCVVVLNKGVC